MRQIDPITQIEKITRCRMPMTFMFTAMMCGGLERLMPDITKIKQGKPKWYYTDLNKRESKLPYEGKQEQRRLKWTLKNMNQRTEIQTIYLYKFR